MTALEPALTATALAASTAAPTPINGSKAEAHATYLCNIFMRYCDHLGISTTDLEARTGVSRWTIRGLRHRKVKNFPQLLNFVKLLAAADLELQIVRYEQGLTPDNPAHDPTPPPTYNTGTEGNLTPQ